MTNKAHSLEQRLAERLQADRDAGLERRLPPIADRQGVAYELDGHRVVGFCSNDYLGLATLDARQASPQDYGSTASRLVCGEHPIYAQVERKLADLAGQPDAVLFPSGFQLNVGVLPALLEADVPYFSDRLNHASLIDGMRLAPGRPQRLAHLAPPPPRAEGDGPRWWICESLYSMDGDGPALSDLRNHLDRGDYLYVDEAHAFGLYAGGRSRLSHAGIVPSAQVFTFGKALGTAGAVFLGSREACDWVRTRARSFVFSTGMSPRLAADIDAAIDRLRSAEGDRARTHLWGLCDQLADTLGVDRPQAPIFPLIVGDPRECVAISNQLLERGFHVQPIRPPTVPEGGSRLRLTLCATHTREQVAALAKALLELLPEVHLSDSPARPPAAKVS